jgi:hypothetical protein
VTISLEELSQILAATEIFSFQEEHILTIVKNLSTSSETIREPKSHELQKDSLCQTIEGVEKLETTLDGKRPLRPEIEEFSTNPLYTLETNHPEEEDMHGMIKESIEIIVDEHQDYIEIWFQKVIRPQYHSFLFQHLLMTKQVGWLVLHIQVITVVIFSYVDMGMFLILLRTWLHWKVSYT